VLELDRSLEDTLPYLLALLSIDDQQSNLAQMDAQIRRRRTLEALKKVFLRESLNHPVILIFEDLHWIDSETQGFLDTLSEGVASAKVLLLVNYRPEYRHEWGQKTYYTQLRLAPFGKAEAEEFLDVLLGVSVGTDRRVGPQGPGAHAGAPLHDLKHLILEKTEGTPFFMEEIVQELIEQGVLIRDGVGADLRPEEVPVGRVGPPPGAHTGAPLHIEAEVYRIKGELLLAQEGLREAAEEAERCFHKAIEVAQKQQAKSLELRATVSLARLWQQQGKHHEARDTLSAIYGWFTEGFETKDLQEAKALLNELEGKICD
jgi:hypothetical protein